MLTSSVPSPSPLPIYPSRIDLLSFHARREHTFAPLRLPQGLAVAVLRCNDRERGEGVVRVILPFARRDFAVCAVHARLSSVFMQMQVVWCCSGDKQQCASYQSQEVRDEEKELAG